MKNKLATLLTVLITLALGKLYAQDEEDPGLTISGSVDTYYKYDFSGEPQINTSFANAQNSIGIGMVDIILSKSVGKASFVGEVAFGPRASSSAPGPVQNLYVSYQFSDLFSLTGGFMSTFVGYEVISPALNFNYSTSYLFSYGPFQNSGVKANFSFSDRFGLMVGIFNQFDSYTNEPYSLSPGGQLFLMPVDGLNMYLNFVSHESSGTEVDLTSTFQATEQLKIGLNVAHRTMGNFFIDDEGNGVPFHGGAAYLNYQVSDPFALGLRYEYLTDRQGRISGFDDPNTSEIGDLMTINAVTLSGNIIAGPLRLIPEIRFDMGSQDIFTDADGNPTGSAAQALVAAVFAF
ncbi:MAG TPA: outer membrane beta-barrel protein [Cyclobacteriaceae bacterium]|nr:outer membrane beta-barrel protein [Cyclobacteriaceae bacterium]